MSSPFHALIKRRVRVVTLIAVISLLLSSCSLTDSIDSAVAKTAVLLDQLTSQLNANGDKFVQLIKDTEAQIPSTLQTVKDDLEQIINDGVTGAAKVAMCDESYVGISLITAVQNLKASLLHIPFIQPTPSVCSTYPASMDPTELISKPATVTYFGFNLDINSEKAELVFVDGTTRAVPVVQTDQYSLHIDLGGTNGVQVPSNAARLDLTNGGGTYSVTFNAPGIPACVAHTELIFPGIFTAEAQRVAGDADWGGNGPAITINTATILYPNQIIERANLNAQEVGGESQAQISGVNYAAYQAPPGYTITGLASATMADSVTYVHSGVGQESPINRGSSSLVRSYAVFTGSADSTSLTMTFNSLYVTLFGPPSGATRCTSPTPPPVTYPPPVTPPVRPPVHVPTPPGCDNTTLQRGFRNCPLRP